MKNHKFWAWAMVICLMMTIITGYEHITSLYVSGMSGMDNQGKLQIGG